MPACFGIRMAAFFLLLSVPVAAFSETLPGPVVIPNITLNEIAEQRTVVAQSFQASKDQQQKLSEIEKRLNTDENLSQPPSSQEAGQAASASEIRNRLTEQQQVLAQIQEEQRKSSEDATSDFLGTQNQIVATQVSSQQQLQQVQGQIEYQRQNVAQLYQTIQTQRATNIVSPLLTDAESAYQQQKDRLDQLESLKDSLAVQAAQTEMAGNFNQTQSSSIAKTTNENLQNRFAEAQKNYQQLQESYQAALSKEDSNRQKASELDDDYKIEKEKQLALDDTYSRESQKLSEMVTSFSRQ
jgi:hypothetical protein